MNGSPDWISTTGLGAEWSQRLLHDEPAWWWPPWVGGCETMGDMRFDVHVEVRLRPGIADPAGSTIERSLPTLGFGGVSGVRVGKSIRFAVEATDEATARAEVEDMCARFLTNPVIEDAVVTLESGDVA